MRNPVDALSVSTPYEYIHIAWYQSESQGIIDAIISILDRESRSPSIRRNEWGMVYSWTEQASVVLSDTPWFGLGVPEVLATLQYLFLVEQAGSTTVFVCSAVDAATHHMVARLASELYKRHKIKLGPANISISADDLLDILEFHPDVKVLGLRILDPQRRGIRSFPRLGEAALVSTLSDLEEDAEIIGIFVQVGDLKAMVQPRRIPGAEPIVMVEPNATKETLVEALRRIRLAFAQ